MSCSQSNTCHLALGARRSAPGLRSDCLAAEASPGITVAFSRDRQVLAVVCFRRSHHPVSEVYRLGWENQAIGHRADVPEGPAGGEGEHWSVGGEHERRICGGHAAANDAPPEGAILQSLCNDGVSKNRSAEREKMPVPVSGDHRVPRPSGKRRARVMSRCGVEFRGGHAFQNDFVNRKARNDDASHRRPRNNLLHALRCSWPRRKLIPLCAGGIAGTCALHVPPADGCDQEAASQNEEQAEHTHHREAATIAEGCQSSGGCPVCRREGSTTSYRTLECLPGCG